MNAVWNHQTARGGCVLIYLHVYIYICACVSSVLFVTSKAFDVMEYTAGWEMGDVISIEDQVDDK